MGKGQHGSKRGPAQMEGGTRITAVRLPGVVVDGVHAQGAQLGETIRALLVEWLARCQARDAAK